MLFPVSLLLLLRISHALDPSLSQSSGSSFSTAEIVPGQLGISEAQPDFFVDKADPNRVPDGGARDWPLDYDLFRERETARDLIEWLRANGVRSIGEASSAFGIEIDYNSSMRASGKARGEMRIVARKNISAGETVAKVPLLIAMTPEIASADSPVEVPAEALHYSRIAAWILRERGKGELSLWHPYIKSLPQYLATPFLYPDDMLALSDYPLLLNETADLAEDLEQQYELFDPKSIANANFSDFVWAFAIATSRLTYLPPKTTLPKFSPNPSPLKNTLSRAGEGLSESDKPGESDKTGSLSWEEEFLLSEEEEEESERESKSKKTKKEGKRKKRSEGGEGKEEEDREPVMLLVPLVDFFDWDDNPNAKIEVLGNVVVVTAVREIGKGEVISVKQKEAQNEKHLWERGFVPDVNSHDGALLFRTRTDAIWYFREKFLSGKFNDNYQAVMDDTFELAEEFLDKEFKKVKYDKFWGEGGEGRPEYSVPWSRKASSFAWWGARMDAHHFAGIAAGHSITAFDKTPNYWDLAPAALTYAWILREPLSCDTLAEMLQDRETDSFPCAGTTIRLKIEDIMRQFNTTVQQDLIVLSVIKLCRELAVFGRTSTGEDFETPAPELLKERCPALLMAYLPEMEYMYKFKISKKIVYSQLLRRLEKTCEMA